MASFLLCGQVSYILVKQKIPNILPAFSNKYKYILLTFSYIIMIQHGSQPPGYERKVRTVPLTRPLQIGHFRSDGAHSLHTTRCPHGIKTMLTSLSIHTLQVRSSWRRRSCSSMGRSAKKKRLLWFLMKPNMLLYIPACLSFSSAHNLLHISLSWKREGSVCFILFIFLFKVFLESFSSELRV